MAMSTATSNSKKSERTRDALLQEGIRQLSAHGYHGTGIKQVLDAVKVPKGSFYNYFDSKEAYVAAIIVEYNREALVTFDQFVAKSKAPAIDLLKHIYLYMLGKFAENQCQQGCLVGSIAAEVGNTYELCQRAMQIGVADWQTRLSRLLAQAQEEGSIRKDLPATDLAELLWSAWEGGLIKMKPDGNTDSAQRVILLMLDKLLAA